MRLQDSKNYEKVDNMLDKLLMVNIKMICGILGLEKNGDKVSFKTCFFNSLIDEFIFQNLCLVLVSLKSYYYIQLEIISVKLLLINYRL